MLEWTGERFIPGVEGDVAIEHLHRYHAASGVVRGLRVLDIACGEGYGSAILAGQAETVVGVDIAPEAVAHARATYPSPRLRFEVGSVLQNPAGRCLGRRGGVLRDAGARGRARPGARRVPTGPCPRWIPDRLLPDRLEYSEVPRSQNPFHVRELYRNEFRDLLGRHFRNVQLYGQRVIYGSTLAPVDNLQIPFVSFRSEGTEVVRGQGVLRPVYLVAVVSDRACPPLPAGTLAPQTPPFWTEVEKLRQALATTEAEAARLKASSAEVEPLRRALETHRATAADLERRVRETRTVLASEEARSRGAGAAGE